MTYAMDGAAQRRLEAYFDRIGTVLGRPERRASFAIYAQGLFGDAERKSVEPMAARAAADPSKVDAMHQRLCAFLTDSPWNDEDVRRSAAVYATDAMQETETIDTWIIDDTGFLKQGRHSVGVQRQYTGSAGKVTNCQVGVSLTVATATTHLPIDFELYLPRSWADDAARRNEARIPAAIPFRTKNELALGMLRRAKAAGVPRGIVLADCAYGNSSDFRKELDGLDLDYIVGIESNTKLHHVLPDGSFAEETKSARELALRLCYIPKQFQRVTWRDGTGGALSARFAFRRVVPAHGDVDPHEQRALWLIAEWRDGEVEPKHFFLAKLPHEAAKKRLVRLAKERWRTERAYQDLKDELGLDHFEGRRFRGWHHHVSVVLCCYAFVVAERVRRFPPCAASEERSYPLALAA